ncbi:hypothetical protein Golax_003421 [Gossypium laxum]|uniref:RNase H type-1 domain-containing protein n=1 Tax=Gossypium laxum TaxID=34288 RepID=A0A7J9AFJ2_9ROSI|nr:hypothetical protein [Gossypium laxum]
MWFLTKRVYRFESSDQNTGWTVLYLTASRGVEPHFFGSHSLKSGASCAKTSYGQSVNLSSHSAVANRACLCGLLAWLLWKNRNLFIFQGKSWSPEEIIITSASWAKHFSLVSRQATDVEIEMTRGEPLAGEWTYLNTDGTVRVDSGAAAAGGVLHDKNGEWILGYNKYLVKAIHESALKTSHSALIKRIHRILSQENSWLLRYIPREKNQSADLIAKLAFREKEDLQLIETP